MIGRDVVGAAVSDTNMLKGLVEGSYRKSLGVSHRSADNRRTEL